MLVALLDEHGGQWIFTAPAGYQPGAEPPVRAAETVWLHPVQVPEPAARQHYELIGIRILLWLFHYLYDTSREPLFDADLLDAWAGFEQVNRAFAERLLSVSDDAE